MLEDRPLLRLSIVGIASLAVLTHFGGPVRGKRTPSTLEVCIRALSSPAMIRTMIVAGISSMAMRRYFKLNTALTLPSFFIFLWGIIYRLRVVELPVVWYRRTYFNTTLVEKSNITKTRYMPIPWAFNRHGQTITCFVLSALEWIFVEPIIYEREEIPAWDPPNVQFLDWASIGDPAKHHINHGYGEKSWDTPIVFLVYGLGNDRDIPYIKRCARTLLNRGWRVVVWSYWRFDFEDSRDMHLALQHIQNKYPAAPLVAIGFSAGAYPLIRYLQKAKQDTPLIAAVTQGGCLDFEQAIHDVTNNETPTYRIFLIIQTKICVWRHVENDKHLTPEQKAEILQMVREENDPFRIFDRFIDITTPRLNEPNPRGTGLPSLAHLAHDHELGDHPDWNIRVKDAANYKSKPIDHMDDIGITTLLLHAEDDPVVSSQHIDWEKVESNRHIIVGHTKRGGHCSWYEGLLPFGQTFGDRISANFLSAVFEMHAQTHFLLSLMQTAMEEREKTKRRPDAPLFVSRIQSSSDLASMRGFGAMSNSPFEPKLIRVQGRSSVSS